MPPDYSSEWYHARYHELMAENRDLRNRLARAQAAADAESGCQVHVVPGRQHLEAAIESLKNEAAEGDKIRVGGTGEEWTFRSGTWSTGQALQ